MVDCLWVVHCHLWTTRRGYFLSVSSKSSLNVHRTTMYFIFFTSLLHKRLILIDLSSFIVSTKLSLLKAIDFASYTYIPYVEAFSHSHVTNDCINMWNVIRLQFDSWMAPNIDFVYYTSSYRCCCANQAMSELM